MALGMAPLVAGAQPKSVLFCRDKDLEREIWDGFRYGPAGAQEFFGVDEAYSITRLDELAPQLLANQPRLYYALGADTQWDGRVSAWLNQLRAPLFRDDFNLTFTRPVTLKS